MYVTRTTSVVLAMIALVASVGGAQASGSKPAAAPAPTAQQLDAAAAQFKQLGLLAYPAKGQSADKQKKDQAECYAWAKDQTGFDPATAAAVNTDSAAKAAKEQTAQATQGAAVKGAAKGAAAGALIGAAAGDAGKGAAVGAAAGGVGGRAGKKRAEKEAGAQAANSATAASNQQVDNFKKAIGTCMTGRGYTFSK
jgi:uncharacterized protein YcfJ